MRPRIRENAATPSEWRVFRAPPLARWLHLPGQEVMTMIPNAFVIPTGLLGTVLEPAALFAAWGVVVVGVLAALSAVLGRDERADGSGNDARRLCARRDERAAA